MITINVLAFVIALALTRGIKGTNIFRTVFFMPNLIGGIILGYIWQLIINGVLSYFGKTITFDASYGFWGMIILMNWQSIGYMMIIYVAGLQNIPGEIPMMMSSITICTFLTLTNSFKMFDQNLALTAGAPSNKTQMLALNIYKTFYDRPGTEGVGQAKAVVFFLIVAAIALLQLRATKSKEVQQ